VENRVFRKVRTRGERERVAKAPLKVLDRDNKALAAGKACFSRGIQPPSASHRSPPLSIVIYPSFLSENARRQA